MTAPEIQELKYALNLATTELKNDIRDLSEKLEDLARIVSIHAQTVRGFEDERLRQMGAAGMVKIVWGVIVTGVAAAAYVLHDVLQFFFPPRGH